MGKIHIDKLTVTGSKGTSSIEFGEHLTIIAGPSDTGKSYIFKCIDYLFGAKTDKKNPPFNPNIGYNKLSMDVTCDFGNITFTRMINSPKIHVETNIEGIESKDYTVSDTIRPIYLKLLGINDEIMVPINENGETERLSWRTIKQDFMIHEGDTEKEGSILIPDKIGGPTKLLSNLLYFLYKQDFSEFDEDDNKKTKAAKRAAVQKYIIERKDVIQERKKIVQDELQKANINNSKLSDIIGEIKGKLSQLDTEIQTSIDENQTITKNILKVQERIQEYQVLIDRYSVLESQYTSDIQRLSFIVDNETIKRDMPSNSNCPFCNGIINDHDHNSYIQASRAELIRTVNNIEGLSKTKNDIENEIKIQSEKLNSLNSKKKKIENFINGELLPKQDSLTNQLNKYQAIIEAQNELNLLNEFSSKFDDDLKDIDITVGKKRKYKPKELFPKSFGDSLGTNYLKLLNEINYIPSNSAEFDMSSFDIIINGNTKSSHGKGYRSLFNSLLVLALRDYFNTKAEINPHFYFIDSPLHGLKATDDNTDENVRFEFFDYLVNNHGNDQIIIIENTNDHDLPKINYEEKGIKLYVFTQKENVGSYGFLEGIRKN